jgi:imidazolonepropionase-like amidohydrolase
MAFGKDILMNPGGAASQGRQLAKLTRFVAPRKALKPATGNAGDLLALSGPCDPFGGRLGVVAEGALADILVWDGDLDEDLDFLAQPDSKLRLIVKCGRLIRKQFA